MSEETKGNPEIGMKEDSFDELPQSPAGSDGFFEALENQVNSGIKDPNEETHRDNGPNMAMQPEVTQQVSQDGPDNTVQSEDSTDWRKRYTDSSREAVKLKEQMNELSPFVPVLEAMKNDSGLVNHVREYLVNGGKPAKTVKEQLNLSEDFVFDANEAMSEPDSDSAKVMNAHVDGLVQKRVGQVLNSEKEHARAYQAELIKRKEEAEFKQKHNMTDEQYADFVQQAKGHVLTLEDVNYLINRDKVATNTANATRADMLNQMKSVRNMPTSASGANSQAAPESQESSVFNALLGMDDDMDNLFG